MGNRQSRPGLSAFLLYRARRSINSSSTAFLEKVADGYAVIGHDGRDDKSVQNRMSETESLCEGSMSEIAICPTQIPPPRTLEGALELISRVSGVAWKRFVEVQVLITNLGGSCGQYYQGPPMSGHDGDLAYGLAYITFDLAYLRVLLQKSSDRAGYYLSRKLQGQVFALLESYGRVIEDVAAMCAKLREAQTGDRLPVDSDTEWLEKNITPVALELASRLKHLKSRLNIVVIDIDMECIEY